MAIEWKNPTDHTGSVKDTYEGRVLSERMEYDVRIMSDVYSNCYYATVWTGTEVKEVSTGTSEFGSDCKVVVDATPETKAAVKAWQDAEKAKALAAWEAAAPEREARRLREEAADRKRRIREAKKYLNTPEKGDRVTVARRRGSKAPPKGTTGKIIWTGESGMGTPRVGILDDSGAKHWTTAGNVDVIRADTPTDTDGVEVWEAYASKIKAVRDAAAKDAEKAKKDRAEAELAALPQKGEWVRLRDDHTKFGKVFWRGVTRTGSARIGIKLRKKDRDAHWAGFRKGQPEFEALTGDPRKNGVPVAPVVPATAPVKDSASTVTITESALYAAAAKTAPINPLGHLPAPFCDIRRIEGNRAYKADGTFIAELPTTVADDLVLALLAV